MPEALAVKGITREFPDELEYLEKTKQALADALRASDDTVERYDREYREHQKYIVDHRMEIDPKEIFQNTLSLLEMDKAGAFAVRFRDKIAKLVDSPYFARIDFRADTEDMPSSIYIGRFAFVEDETHVIYDWRAPISSMFYDCGLGSAFYIAPVGRVEGELTRKRQFKIVGGKMQYCLESSVNIGDEILQRELSQTSDDRMKSIIATIQKEQNRIIRNEQAETLVIQGVAGSGKTSIALHRIAYLLYRHKDRLSAKNVVILSPNKVFGDYISGVLPELGEEPLYEMSFADVAVIQLEGVVDFAPPPDPAEDPDPGWVERASFKSTVGFLQKIDEYLAMVSERYFEAAPYTYGSFTVSTDYILGRFHAYRHYPIKRRLREVGEDVLGQFQNSNLFDEDLPQKRTVVKYLTTMFKVRNTLALYKDFYRWLGQAKMFHPVDEGTLEWEDVYPFLYFRAAFEGLKENKIIRHLVIDEMQDYTPVQFAVINLLFQCKKTILGDYGQIISPCQVSMLEDLQRIYEDVEILKLNTSYRSSYEIISFARNILSVSGIEPVERHGDEVDVVCYADAEGEIEAVKVRIHAFYQSGWATMGIILKTRQQARELYRCLCHDCDVNLLDADSISYTGGVSITSVQMSKGLEFDEVLVVGVNAESYRNPFDRNLLYVACTRAMHKLSLTCHGQPAEAIESTIHTHGRT